MEPTNIKYVRPNKFTHEPYGTIHTIKFGDSRERYIQVSKDEDNPNWIPLGTFLEKAFEHQLGDRSFIDETLHLYNEKQITP